MAGRNSQLRGQWSNNGTKVPPKSTHTRRGAIGVGESQSAFSLPDGVSRRSVLLGLGGTALAWGGLTYALTTGVLDTDPIQIALPEGERDIPDTTGSIPGHLRIILLDSSDPTTATQDLKIENVLLGDVLRDLDPNDRLVAYGLSENPFDPVQKLFDQTVPARASDTNSLTGNKSNAEQEWAREFRDPYVRAIRRAWTPDEREQSPVIEGLVELSSLARLLPAQSKEIIVVSDCLQHVSNRRGTTGYTHYRRDNNKRYPKLDKLPNVYRPDFSGINIRVVYINRLESAHRQTSQHQKWVKDFFAMHNAGTVTWDRV